MAPTSPTVACWAIGRRLRERREEAAITGAAAAKRVGVTPAYLSDIEHGKKNLAEDRLDVLIATYGIEEEEARELRSLRASGAHRGWWNAYSALFNSDLLRFFGFEHGAETVDVFDSDLINGLFQTEDYARAVIEAGSPNVRLAEVDRRVKCRLVRRQRITGDEPLKLNAVMSEAVLWQRIGGPEVLADQLDHLSALIERYSDNLAVQVVPFTSTGHDAMGSSAFHIMTFPSGKLPALLWQETVTSTGLISDPTTVREYGLAHGDALKAALGRDDSLALIRKVAGQIR
ncbi:helix-turn-helix transcriptional regulator [Saccharopolyspora sp. HNM0986]|uniref:helix-turn-helix domain-containing protein n=1 Tax=Saccharopolyspora galaxeae TaxID=2781241 RepID=UPI00190E0158|nr:helix-turn-helix transcriptional regulator [Saccharopolyspora sp. HNM0986]MBK0866818.1 helix-turn-helix transcriptional regulator [Saccharopolyspora sp. HNM0986]